MKKILFIAPVFFGYYKEIIKELEGLDYEVDYVSDSASNSNFFKAMSRLNKKFVILPMKKYFKDTVIPKITAEKYDYVFLISAMSLSFTPDMMKKIREAQKQARFIMYQWDGEKNIPYIIKFHKYFDKNFTFDRIDAEQKKEIYNFLPLFYIKEYEEIGKEECKKYQYDITYIGTAHPQKFIKINEIAEKVKGVYPIQFIYHYLPSKFKYYYHKLKDKEYRKIKISDLKMQKIPKEKIIEIFKKSRCIIDAPQKGQNGLTIRTIECLGAKRKLITTNKDIINYDFYNENNILIYDENYNEDLQFFKNEYQELSSEIYDKYSLKNWLKTILS